MLRNAILGGAVFILFLIGSQSIADEPAQRPNVLFIAIDDLNHWVGHLGRNKQVQTPNIDRLAARGVTFTRATVPHRSAIRRAQRFSPASAHPPPACTTTPSIGGKQLAKS